jgi:hypothetical protein
LIPEATVEEDNEASLGVRVVDGRFERIAAAAGFAMVVMTFVGVAMYPNLRPPYDEAAVRAAYLEGAAAASWSAVLQLLGIVPFTIFLVGLWRRLRRTDEALAMITLLGGIGTILVIHIWQAVLVGLIAQASFVDAGTDFRPVLAVVSGIDQSITLPLAIMMGAAGVAIISGRALPRWLGWLAILTSVAAIVGVLAILVVFADRGVGQIVAAANPIALLLFLIWVTGVSIVFARSERQT